MYDSHPIIITDDLKRIMQIWVWKRNPDQCWLWTRGKIKGNYGYINIPNGDGTYHSVLAHRVAYVLGSSNTSYM